MDKKAVIREHLEMARRHVADGERLIARQRELIAELEGDGHDGSEPRQLLEEFEDILRLHIEDRDRLEKELTQNLD